MSTSITINGNTYEMNMVEISEEQFNILNEEGCESETWRELEEELMGDSLINGFTYSDNGPHFSVYVKNKRLEDFSKVLVSGYREGYENSASTQIKPTEKTYHLVYEKYCKKARFHLELSGKFNPANLELSFEYQNLPDGGKRSVVWLSHAPLDFEFIESWTDSEEIYILTSDGERFDL